MPLSPIQSKLVPPRPQRFTLVRPRLLARLRESMDYRVTLVQASTGYGKSTVLAQLGEDQIPVFWYTAGEDDADAQRFLVHLMAALGMAVPSGNDNTLALVHGKYSDAIEAGADSLVNALSEMIKKPSRLIIDDYHFASCPEVDALMDRILTYLPQDLHAIVATRYPPGWEHLASWRAHSQLLEIKREDLIFTRDEVERLFRDHYETPVSPQELDSLLEMTEGWPIALRLVSHEIKTHGKFDIAEIVSSKERSSSLDALFAFLARDVLAQQPASLQRLLIHTSVLRELTGPACEAITGETWDDILSQLRGRDLLLIDLGDGVYRYHHLFRDFLYDQAVAEDESLVNDLHIRAAAHFQKVGELEEAVYHLLRARAIERAADLIEGLGDNTLKIGKLETLSTWLKALPEETIRSRPLLTYFHGELARLRSRFDEALKWYAQAERMWRESNQVGGVGRALRGQALVYLDTLRTPEADRLLQQALALSDDNSDGTDRPQLLELLAENKLNMGRVQEAERLRRQAREDLEDDNAEDTLGVRVMMRTGRLDEARRNLEAWRDAESNQLLPPRAHRETLLLLSLVHSAQGNVEEAFETARRGIALGATLDSPYISAVGQVRLGHAHELRGEWRQALDCYERAVRIGDELGIARVRAEARWGTARTHGKLGDLATAERHAAEGIEIARKSGDIWIAAQVQLALASAYIQTGLPQRGLEVLVDALVEFHTCADSFGMAATWMWMALAESKSDHIDRALDFLKEALALAQANHYEYLFTRTTLLGWQDPCVTIPLLLEMQQKSGGFASQLLSGMGLEGLSQHPGYQLRVQTFGMFRVWRGQTEIPRQEWQRKKARQLLQLLITFRGRMLGREEIFEHLWRDESPEAAARDFKVALNAVNRVLEPDRPASDSAAFIRRVESAYSLSTGADVWIDADEFSRLIARSETTKDADASVELLERALALYQDDYLKLDSPYDDWAIGERERLLALYLKAADRIASRLYASGDLDECESWCRKILQKDRCWEQAYRLLIKAHASRGNFIQARRTFDDCARILSEELGLPPSPATMQALQQALARS